MSDITMCKGQDCPMAKYCYRHNAKQNEYRQAWFMESPIVNGECSEFIEHKEPSND